MEDVGEQCRHHQQAEEGQHRPGEGQQLGHVGVVPPAAARSDPFVDGDGDVAPVEREHREEVEDPEEDVDDDQDGEELPDPRLGGLRRGVDDADE